LNGRATPAMARLLCTLCALAGAHALRTPTLRPVVPAAARRSAPTPVLKARGGTQDTIVPGVGAGRELPAPSGINTLDTPLQAAFVIGVLVAIGLGAAAIAGPAFDQVRGSGLWNLSRPTWPLLGFIYLAAGIAHFTEADGFENITPPNGTWGFFYTPFSPRVNVLWTGVVEVFGGAWMLFGAGADAAGVNLPAALGPVISDGALTLYLLTWIVTPANLYALTHGANFPLDLETPPKAHAVRLAFQSVLLAMLWEMSQPTIIDAKVNLGLPL